MLDMKHYWDTEPLSLVASVKSLQLIFLFFFFLDIIRIVSTYLVHHGYCATAEAFAKSTGQSFTEELASIKNRQRESINNDCRYVSDSWSVALCLAKWLSFIDYFYCMEYCDLGRGLSHLTTDPLDHLQDIADVDFEEICRERNCYLFPLFTVLFLVGFFGFLVCFFGKILSLHVICIFIREHQFLLSLWCNKLSASCSFFLSFRNTKACSCRQNRRGYWNNTDIIPRTLRTKPKLAFPFKMPTVCGNG